MTGDIGAQVGRAEHGPVPVEHAQAGPDGVARAAGVTGRRAQQRFGVPGAGAQGGGPAAAAGPAHLSQVGLRSVQTATFQEQLRREKPALHGSGRPARRLQGRDHLFHPADPYPRALLAGALRTQDRQPGQGGPLRSLVPGELADRAAGVVQRAGRVPVEERRLGK